MNVREAVAWNKNSTDKILHRLSKDSNFRVRRGVAQNKATPYDTLQSLLHDEDKFVKQNAKENLEQNHSA